MAETPYMAAAEWGPLGFRSLPLAPAQDLYTETPRFRWANARYPGSQRRCGVEQLSNGFSTPTASDVPYWQQTVFANPPQLRRSGGQAQAPLGVLHVSDMLATPPVTKAGGVGTILRVRELLRGRRR